jgi:hypothetical protein
MTARGTSTPSSADNGQPPDPEPALAYAHQLLSSADLDTAGLWPRTAARLIRVALERATDRYWSHIRPELKRCPTTIRLLMLEQQLGRNGARRAYLVWSRLSDATHPHPYELAPTVGELERWHEDVTQLVHLLSTPCEQRSARWPG